MSAKFRRAGIGKQLMQFMADYCIQWNLEWISFTVLAKNLNAKKFYKSLGANKISIDFFAIDRAELKKLSKFKAV